MKILRKKFLDVEEINKKKIEKLYLIEYLNFLKEESEKEQKK